MFFNNIKHNLIIIFCILLMINGCNYENSKLIIENNNKAEKTNKSGKISLRIPTIFLTKKVIST